MPYKLNNEHLSNIARVVAANRQVQQAVLFGSQAKGTQRPGSDIALKREQFNT